MSSKIDAEIAKLDIILFHKENNLAHPDLQDEIDKFSCCDEIMARIRELIEAQEYPK